MGLCDVSLGAMVGRLSSRCTALLEVGAPGREVVAMPPREDDWEGAPAVCGRLGRVPTSEAWGALLSMVPHSVSAPRAAAILLSGSCVLSSSSVRSDAADRGLRIVAEEVLVRKGARGSPRTVESNLTVLVASEDTSGVSWVLQCKVLLATVVSARRKRRASPTSRRSREADELVRSVGRAEFTLE